MINRLRVLLIVQKEHIIESTMGKLINLKASCFDKRAYNNK